MRAIATLALALVAATATGCWPFLPEEPAAPIEDLACGEAPAASDPADPASEVVYAVGTEGCVRIERRALDDGSFVPLRLVVHVEGFTRRFDVDSDALTYEGAPGGGAVVTSDDVTATLAIDVCTGAWTVEVGEGEAILAVQ